jgi:hypothetical protein
MQRFSSLEAFIVKFRKPCVMTGAQACTNDHVTYGLRHLVHAAGCRLGTCARVATLARSATFAHLADTAQHAGR